MTRIFIIENESEDNKFYFHKIGAKVFDLLDSKENFNSLRQVEKSLDNDCVIYEIKVPEVNTCGFIRVLDKGSITVTIPLSDINDKQRQLEQCKEINSETDKYVSEFSNLKELHSKISDIKQLCLNISLRNKNSIFDQNSSATQSQKILEAQPAKTTKSTDDKSKFSDNPLLRKVFQFIEHNYQLTITLCDVAQAVGYSAAYLTHQVRLQTGKTVNHWIVERRMAAARKLLLETNQSANQVALAVGYQHEGHFFRQFRQYHGTTPQAWRKIQRFGNHGQPMPGF